MIRTPNRPKVTAIHHLTGIGYALAARIERHYNELYREWQKFGSHDKLFTGLTSQPGLYSGGEHLTDTEILALIETNPYELRNVRGINFKRADNVAMTDYDINPDHPLRHTAANQSIVEQFGPLPLWKYDRERERQQLTNKTLRLAGVIEDHNRAWLPSELHAEQRIAELFEDVLTSNNQPPPYDVSNLNLGELNEEQLNAVAVALSGTRLMALTGGAGSGKTRVTAAVAHSAKATRKTIRVMAFAGKAAMRSQEAMLEDGVDWVECSTIHRALGLRQHDSAPNPILEDIIILDEASMIPNWLLGRVVQAMRPTATLMLVGDPHQLPPIGYGTPFQDYLELGLPHVHLVKNYRQAGQVSIFEFAEAIRQSNPNLFTPTTPPTGVNPRFAIDTSEAEQEFNQTILDAAELPHHEWQVVTWKNDTKDALNQHLQELLNPNSYPLFSYRLWSLKDANGRYPDAAVCVGDKILITSNDYEHGVFNGQTGLIIDADGRDLTVDFGPGEGERTIPIDDARDLMQLGYCVTVHKAQGSGWDTIILYQPEQVRFSPRRFYYTSVTRAKNHVHLFTTLSRREFWVNAMQPDNNDESTLTQRVHEAR